MGAPGTTLESGKMKRDMGCRYGMLAVSIILLAAGIASSASTQSQIVIVRDDQVIVYFDVELAVTPDERKRGLMWREDLPRGSGMLFDFGGTGPISMWMKNTLIPLDMLFVDAAGCIVDIKESTVPRSTQVIRGARLSRYVLEINGGEARLRGIGVGDCLKPIR